MNGEGKHFKFKYDFKPNETLGLRKEKKTNEMAHIVGKTK